MVGIWKIGTAPGLGTKSIADKEWYLSYALGVKPGFAAIGYGFIDRNIRELYNADVTEAERIIQEALIRADKGKIWKRIEEIRNFANNIAEKSVIVHYFTDEKAYVGVVKNNYYFVDHDTDEDYFGKKDQVNRAPHRVDVEWLEDEAGTARLFDGVRFNWYDTVHRILPEDLNRVDNMELREYLERKIRE